jgi:hypothetical protein
MFGKQQRADMVYLLWYGEAMLSDHTPTPEEVQRFIEAREQSIKMARVVFRIMDHEYAYTPGKTFQES